MNGGADETEELLSINFQISATETQKAWKCGNKKIPQIASEDLYLLVFDYAQTDNL
jgi:hypothetical protein